MIVSGVSTQAKVNMLQSLIERGCMIALYGKGADIHAGVSTYTRKGEVDGPGYKAGGKELEGARVELDGDVACLTFNDAKWPVCTIVAEGALIYDKETRETIVAMDFGGPKTASNGPFTVFMPLCSRDTALVCL